MDLKPLYPAFFFWGLFMVLAVIVVITAGTSARLRYILKPLALPCLMAFYVLYSSGTGRRPEPVILSALGMGLLGDIFFLWQGKKRFFIAGLFSFLLGHIFYGFYFAGTLEVFSLGAFRFAAALAVYLAASWLVFWMVRRKALPVRISVGLYLLVIASSNFIILQRSWTYSGLPFWLPYAGSVLFIVSDILIVARNFYRREKWQSRVISLTYQSAQALLVLGVLAPAV